MLKVRVKRHTGQLRHLTLAFLHYFLKLLGAELASIGANQYAILIVVWHTFLLSTSGLMVTLGARWMFEILIDV